MDKFPIPHAMGLSHFERTFMQPIPFSLLYWAEAMVPIDVMVPSAHLAMLSKTLDSHDRLCDIEALRRGGTTWRTSGYHTKSRSSRHTRKSKPSNLLLVNLLCWWLSFKSNGTCSKGLKCLKICSKWEGPYAIREANYSNDFLISNSVDLLAPINSKWPKLY